MCLKKGPGLRKINVTREIRDKPAKCDLIRRYWWSAYNPSDTSVPQVLCLRCRDKLNKQYMLNIVSNAEDSSDGEQEDEVTDEECDNILPPMIPYELMPRLPVTRQIPYCTCDICLIARYTKRGLEKTPPLKILSLPETKKKPSIYAFT
jgi:hypothetical protein